MTLGFGLLEIPHCSRLSVRLAMRKASPVHRSLVLLNKGKYLLKRFESWHELSFRKKA